VVKGIDMNQKLIDKGIWWEEGVELVSGCSPCSPGCDNCWSADMTHRFTHHCLSNVWLGCTICTQPEADEKIPVFLQVPGKKFLCLEPLLEEIDIDFALPQYDYRPTYAYYRAAYPGMEDKPVLMKPGVDAVIVGTETGPHRRPAKLEWIESIIDQCDAAGVKVFVKALEIGGKVSKDINDFPQKLRRRELPWL
jgi:protein gp37